MNFLDTPIDVAVCIVLIVIYFITCTTTAVLIRASIRRAVLLSMWHILFFGLYAVWTWNQEVDATFYFKVAQDLRVPLDIGTSAVIWFTAIPADMLNFSYLNTTLFYSIFSASGILLIDRVAVQSARDLDPTSRTIILIFPFLPSLHFWTSAVGKDAIVVFGIGMVVWASQNISRRMLLLFIGALIVFTIRPHMGGLIAITFWISRLFDSSMSARKRTLIIGMGLPIVAYAVIEVMGRLGIQANLDLEAVEEFVRARQLSNVDGGSSINLIEMNVLERAFAYLFRPTFFDAGDLLFLIAALENLALLLTFLWLSLRACLSWKSYSRIRNRFFLAAYAFIGLLVLSQTTANLGLALRQKWMLVPLLFLVTISLIRPVGRRRTTLT